MWPYIYLDIQLGPVGQEIYSIELSIEGATNKCQLFNTWHELSSVIPFNPPKQLIHMFTRCQNLIAKVLHTSHPLSKITEPPAKGVRINYHSSVLWSMGVKIQISLYISPSSGLFFISPDEDLLFEVETSRVNFLVSFNSDDQRNTDVATTADVTTYFNF